MSKSVILKKLILIQILILAFSICNAQQKPEDYINKFFDDLKVSHVKAIDNLYNTNPWMDRSKDALDEVKSQLGKLNVDFVGKLYGQELITQKNVSENFKLYSYIAKYDRQPIRFIFEFYKPNDKWMIYSFKFDASLPVELEQAAQISLLNLDSNR
jgi:hypothetical protein